MKLLHELIGRLLGRGIHGERDQPDPFRAYSFYWINQARAWDSSRRTVILGVLLETLAAPEFEANLYERRYRVPEIDEGSHSGTSLAALAHVLRVMADIEQEASEEQE